MFSQATNSHYLRFLKLNFDKNKQISFIDASVARSRPISLRYQFDSRRLLVAHFASLSCGSATQLAIATLTQARAFSSASFYEFHNPQDSVGNLLWLVSIICAKDRFELLSTPN